MYYFKQWLYDNAYDIGTEDELLVPESAFGTEKIKRWLIR